MDDKWAACVAIAAIVAITMINVAAMYFGVK